MKKLIFVLAILAAVPAFGALSVNITRLSTTQLEITYSGADPCNLPRMFTLDLAITSPGTFTDVTGYFVGECNETQRGYGIYPARITFDVNDDVNSWGTPLASEGSPGTTDQVLPSSHIVFEFASLYVDPNAPPTSGRLCYVNYACNGGFNLTVAMNAETTYRGGIVLEDGTQDTVNKTLAVCVTDCMKSPTDTPPTPAAEYNAWVAWGKPACWCCKKQCNGDMDCLQTGPFWVSANDLSGFKKCLNKPDSQLPPECICADFDHTKTGLFRISSIDLAVFKLWFNKPNVPCCDLDHDCILTAADKFNFWTN